MVIDKKSWHYHIVSTYTDTVNHYEINNSCSYVRKLLLGMLNIFMDIVLGSILLYSMILDPLLWIIATRDFDIDNFPVGSKAGAVLWVMFLILTLLVGISVYKDYHKDKPEGFIKKSYKAWKNKICVGLEFD